MNVTIYLRNGQTITFRAESITTERNEMTGDLTRIAWVPEGGDGPKYVRLGQVDAIVTSEDEEGGR